MFVRHILTVNGRHLGMVNDLKNHRQYFVNYSNKINFEAGDTILTLNNMVYVNSKSQEIQAAIETADKIRDFDYFSAEIGSYFTSFNVIKEYESLYLTKTNVLGKWSSRCFVFDKLIHPLIFNFGIELRKMVLSCSNNFFLR